MKTKQINEIIKAQRDKLKAWSGEGNNMPTPEAVKKFRAENRASALKKEYKLIASGFGRRGKTSSAVKKMLNTSFQKLANQTLSR